MLTNLKKRSAVLIVALIGIIALSMMSCRSPKEITTTQAYEREIVTEVIRDTVVKVEPDKAILQALLECDEKGAVLVKQLLNYEAGARLHPPKVDIRDNILTATAEVDSMSIYLALKDRYIEKIEGVTKEIVKVIEVNVLTGWQKFRIWIGSLTLLLIPAGAYLKIKKII